MNRIQINTLLISTVGVLSIFLTVYFFRVGDRTLPNYATVIGTICSLVGLAIAYVNIVELKKTSIEMNKQIEKTLIKVNQLNSVADISKAIKTNQEIQQFIRNGKIELAHLRTLDLKHMLLQFGKNAQLENLTKNRTYKQLVIDFNIDLTSINDNLLNPERIVDYSKVVHNLESLSTHLTQFELQLKSIVI